MKPVGAEIRKRGTGGARSWAVSMAATAVTLMLVGCAGGVGQSNSGSEGGGEGFSYGASQSEVNELINDLEPVTLVYQAEAASPNAISAPSAVAFKEEVEQRSNGQITIEIAWGQSIAGYTEVVDALSDGRVDIAIVIPLYEPSRFPAYDDFSVMSHYAPASPMTGELAAAGMIAEQGWSQSGLIEEIEDNGMYPLTPFLGSGDYYFFCNENNQNNQLIDWNGRQVRSNTTLHQAAVSNLGVTPVSLEYGETFEALQRNTVDCTLQQAMTSSAGGTPEVAPYVSYQTGKSFGNRSASGYMAGASWATLPLAYQQILFDAEPAMHGEWMAAVIGAAGTAIDQVRDAGGDVQPLPEDVQEKIAESQAESAAEAADTGMLGDDPQQQAQELADKWEGVVSGLGYEDGGDISDVDEWYIADEMDFGPMAEKIFEEVSLPHRPGSAA